MRDSYKVGIIGTGKMGGIMANAILDKDLVFPENLFLYDKVTEKLKPFINKGAKSSCLEEIAKEADIIIIAVKPNDVRPILQALKEKLESSQIVVSCAAGVKISFISKLLEKSVSVVRVMPNAAISVDEGVCALSTGSVMDAKKIGFIERIFNAVGKVVELPEEKLDAVTGLSGSGPAYVYMMIEGLIRGGEKAGLSREISRKLAIQTVLGAAKTAQANQEEIQQLISCVATPGGTTAKGMEVLQKGNLIELFAKAILEATKRAQQISSEIEKQ